MEPFALAGFILIVLILGLYAGWALGWPGFSRQGKKTAPALMAVPTCEGCRFFSLKGGQTLMRSHPAFASAAEIIPPWQMSQPRKVEPNPEYDKLEEEMNAAGMNGEHELQRRLHDELLTMNPGELLPPESYTEESMLKLQWADFGACGQHQELRARTDSCDKYAKKPTEIPF